MKQKGDKSISVYAAGVLIRHLDAFEGEIAGVQQAQDIEYIHRMRVATRRLRSALTLFWDHLPSKKREFWQQQFRNMTKALGAARDTDVQLEVLHAIEEKLPGPAFRPGIARLLLRHRQRRVQLQSDVLKTLDNLATSGVLPDLRLKLTPWAERQDQVYLYSPALYHLGFDAVTAALDAFLAYEPYIAQPECIQELHNMRIAAKKLRYTLEALAPLYSEDSKGVLQTLRLVQEYLGDIHDCDMWIQYIPAFIEKERQRALKYYGHTRTFSRLNPGLNYFLKDRQEHREKKYQAFLVAWQEIKEQQVWLNLRQMIQTPFNLSQARQMIESAGTETGSSDSTPPDDSAPDQTS
jgi:CHAD domain-containing protein